MAKVISFDKFRYQQEKEAKKQMAHKSGGELKQIRVSGRAAENDLKIKAKKIDEFLMEGNKVEINLVMRGREKANPQWAREKLNNFLTYIATPYKITSPQKAGGRGIFMQIAKS